MKQKTEKPATGTFSVPAGALVRLSAPRPLVAIADGASTQRVVELWRDRAVRGVQIRVKAWPANGFDGEYKQGF